MTVAGVLRLSLALQVIGGALLAALLLPAGWRWAAIPIGLAIPTLSTASSLATQLLVDAWFDPRSPRGSWRNALRVFGGETAASLVAFCWLQPFRSDFPDPPVVPDPNRPAVLLVHGYACNRAVWRPMLEAGVLDACNIATVNLEPVFADIDDYAALVDRAIARLQQASGAARAPICARTAMPQWHG